MPSDNLTLVQLRQKIAEQDGRLDLVNIDWTDNGLDYYINAGSRFLDSYRLTPKSYKWLKKDIAVGDYFISVERLLALKEVWMRDATTGWQLVKKSLGYIKENYPGAVSGIGSGLPTYFARVVTGLAPEQRALTSVNYTNEFTFGSEDIIFSDQDDGHYKHAGILWMPPTSGIYTIEILGQFMSDPLVAETDRNFWTTQFPEVLMEATNMIIEKTYRNTAGVKDRMGAIDNYLIGLDHNLVEEEISGRNQMDEEN